jgi:RNA polymerase sigma factor (sigma-70 family)
MKEEVKPLSANNFALNSTRWTVVLAAAQTDADGQAALSEFCKIYWTSLFAFAKSRGFSPEDAQDLTQGFFLHLLDDRTLSRVDPIKGKFRTFLLVSFRHYIANETARKLTLKRGRGYDFAYLDCVTGDSELRLELADNLTPETIYDAHCGMALLRQSMRRLRNEFVAEGKISTFEALEVFVRIGDSRPLPTYEELAKSIGVSIPNVKTVIHRLRKRFSAILREEVARTVSDPSEVDDEIRALCEALVAAGERVQL